MNIWLKIRYSNEVALYQINEKLGIIFTRDLMATNYT